MRHGAIATLDVALERARETLRPSAIELWNRFLRQYRTLTNISEIYDDIALKWLAGALLLGFHVTFSSWSYSPLTTTRAVADGSYVCWPMFQDCKSLIWLSTLPDGYSQTTLYMGLFGIMVLAG